MVPRDLNFLCNQKHQDRKGLMAYIRVIFWIILYFSLAKEKYEDRMFSDVQFWNHNG